MRQSTFLLYLWLSFSIALIILGIVCIINPLDTMVWLTYIIAFLILLSGVGSIIYFIQNRYAMVLLDGLLSFVLGLVLLFGGESIAENFVPFLIAIWLIIKGILWIIHAIRVRDFVPNIAGIIIIGAICIVLGVVFLIFPQILATLISFALGSVLIINGCVGIYYWNSFRKLS